MRVGVYVRNRPGKENWLAYQDQARSKRVRVGGQTNHLSLFVRHFGGVLRACWGSFSVFQKLMLDRGVFARDRNNLQCLEL